ncbi:MAG: hypothetical protein CL843_00410 [Crocinitomicaceae bacterium]|nr:hypothetical protein [Crocinitomicaceae bacterium]|tara:strand:+ start:306 stop:659 length:354 start_codon:yes stop_codon:yes gene_type:complete
MKNHFLILFFLVITPFCYSQELIKEKCKPSEVTLIELKDQLPKEYIVVSLMTMRLEQEAKQLSELDEDQIKKIQKWARKFDACTVYLDFDQLYLNRAVNPDLPDLDLTFLIVLKKNE